MSLNRDGLSCHEIDKSETRSRSKVLALLRCINPVKANLDFLAVSKDLECIAIGDANNAGPKLFFLANRYEKEA